MMVESAAPCFSQVHYARWIHMWGFELRKAISTLVVAFAFVAGASGVASAATAQVRPHVQPTRCGTKYTPACTKPVITNNAPSPQCAMAGASYKLPKFTFVSNTGLAKIELLLDGSKVIKDVTFTGQGPTQDSLDGVSVPTSGLSAGKHTVTVTATDIAGKSSSKTLNFAICQAKPVFTG
jgi:hypothetical protein